MLQNYLKVAFRSLWKNKSLSFLNISGMALGVAVFALMMWHVRHERSFDRYHSRHERIYRLAMQVDGKGYENGIAKVEPAFAELARKEIPEVDEAVRFVRYGEVLVQNGARRFYENGGMFADSTVFKIFDFNLKKGDPASALFQPNAVVLTETFARRFFGDEDPLGKFLKFDNQTDMQVTGVMNDVPPNSHFRFDFLASMASYQHPEHDKPRWWQYYTYLLLSPGASPETVAAKVKNAIPKYLQSEEAATLQPFLQPLADIHLKSNLHRELEANSNIRQVWIFSAAAIFLLLIACINFVNLTTAFAARRTKEVGVRKATGAQRRQLVGQFLCESLLATFLAVALGSQLMTFLAPVFAQLTGSEMQLRLTDPAVLIFLLSAWLVVGLAAGSYPALVLSSFQPVFALKTLVSTNGAGGVGVFLRKGLVVFQFALSAFLIIAALVMFQQNNFLNNKDLGFDREQLVILSIRDEGMRNRLEAFKSALRESPGVVNVSVSGNLPGGRDYGIPWAPEGVAEGQIPPVRSLVVDHDFIKTYGMGIAAGRDFSAAFATDTVAWLINEEAARVLGWDNPLGKSIAMPAVGRGKAPVVGVVKDFNFHSLHEPVGALLFFIPPKEWMSYVSVRIRPENVSESLAFMEKKWNDFDPNYPFVYEFLDVAFGQMYMQEKRTASLANAMSLLAIFIACLGLFGLAAHAAEQRKKEIGVRKVLGASTAGLVGLLSKDFLKLVVVALVIASPLAYFFMERWLQNFAYRIDIQWTVFALAGVTVVAVAFLTVSFQSVKAALANPVKSLRSE